MSNETLKVNYLDKIVKVIKTRKKFTIYASIIIFIFLLTFLFYKNFQEKNNINIAEKYTQALILTKQKKVEESKLLLEKIINKNHQFYSPLALYHIIDNDIEKDTSKVITSFDKILKNNSISKENLNLIKIKKAIYLINLKKEKDIIATLNPVINSNSVWKTLAVNTISEYFLSNGQEIKAEEYNQLLNSKIKK
jgi:hypothetical protein